MVFSFCCLFHTPPFRGVFSDFFMVSFFLVKIETSLKFFSIFRTLITKYYSHFILSSNTKYRELMANLINIPSIQNLVDEGRTKHFYQEVKELFRPQIYETFPINDFVSHLNYKIDQRFRKLVEELKDWNKRVDAKNIPKDARAEFYRNSFLFTSLKSLLISDSKGSPHYEMKINNLFEWLRNTNKCSTPQFSFVKKKNVSQDDDWKVRKTFKSNLPQQITNYERRMMFASQEQFKKFYSNRKQFYSQQQIAGEEMGKREYGEGNLKVREKSEEEEVKRAKSLLRVRQARFNEDHSQNEEYFQGQFNVLSKTTEFFNKMKKRASINFTKNSFSSLSKQATEIQNIKRYRLAKFLPKRDQLLIERTLQKNKTVASFITSLKPFDLTSPDIDERGKKKQGRQMSIQQECENKGMGDGVVGSYSTDEFVDFHELKNWEGSRLMSNPFQHHKKPLKKKKKK